MERNRLHNIVSFYVRKNCTDEVQEEFTEALEKELRDEVRNGIEEHDIREMKARLEKEEHEERDKLRRQRIAVFALDAVIIAFLVGFLVNQATSLVERIQEELGWGAYATPGILIAISLLILVLFLIFRMGLHINREKAEDDE